MAFFSNLSWTKFSCQAFFDTNRQSTTVDLGQKNEKWDFNLAYVVHLYTYQVRLNAKIMA